MSKSVSISLSAAKKRSKEIKSILEERGNSPKVADCQHILSHVLGYKNWQTLNAQLKEKGSVEVLLTKEGVEEAEDALTVELRSQDYKVYGSDIDQIVGSCFGFKTVARLQEFLERTPAEDQMYRDIRKVVEENAQQYLPGVMEGAVYEHYRPAQELVELEVPEPGDLPTLDWKSLIEQCEYFWECSIEDVDSLTDEEWETWLDFVWGLFEETASEEAKAELRHLWEEFFEDENGDLWKVEEWEVRSEQSEDFFEFFDSPSEDILKKNLVLRSIPQMTEIARLAKAQRKEFLLRNLCDTAARVDYCEGFIEASGTPLEGAGCGIACDMSIASSHLLSDPDSSIRIFGYRATFTLTDGAGGAKVIGVAAGELIEPYRGGSVPVALRFLQDMDGASAPTDEGFVADPNEVAKVILYEYLPEHPELVGADPSRPEFFTFCGEKDRSIATIEVNLLPEYRGKRLMPTLLRLLRQSIDEGGLSIVIVDELEGLDKERSKRSGFNPVYDYIGVPYYFVCPVPGTPQPGPHYVQIQLAYSPQKVAKKIVDLEVEKRKYKLMRYLKSLSVEGEFDVITYDPWEYPPV